MLRGGVWLVERRRRALRNANRICALLRRVVRAHATRQRPPASRRDTPRGTPRDPSRSTPALKPRADEMPKM